MGFLDLLPAFKTVLDNIQKENKEDPNQKTAIPNVFERVHNKVKEVENETSSSHVNQEQALLELLRQKIEDSQRENREAADEETAESAVFEKMRAEMEQLLQGSSAGRINRGAGSRQIPNDPNRYKIPTKTPQMPDHSSNQSPTSYDGIMPGMMGTTDSGGGSISLRAAPDMGAPSMTDRIPHGSQVKVIETTRANQVNIDGKISGWCRVNYNGLEGWMLDKYLNV